MSFLNYCLIKLNFLKSYDLSLLSYFIVKRTSVFLGNFSISTIWASKYWKSESVQLSISSLVNCKFCLRTCFISISMSILKEERLSATLFKSRSRLRTSVSSSRLLTLLGSRSSIKGVSSSISVFKIASLLSLSSRRVLGLPLYYSFGFKE